MPTRTPNGSTLCRRAAPAFALLMTVSLAAAGHSNQALAGAGKPGHHHGKGHHQEKPHHDGKEHHHGKAKHHDGGGMHHGGMPGGQPGIAAEVDRKIVLVAKDIEFGRKSIQVKDGETIRFVIDNVGELVHEFTIGPPEMQKAHQEEMLKMMESGKLEPNRIVDAGEHSHPNTVLIGPRKKMEIIWKSSKAQKLEFGCNIPGHYEAGMKGNFRFSGG